MHIFVCVSRHFLFRHRVKPSAGMRSTHGTFGVLPGDLAMLQKLARAWSGTFYIVIKVVHSHHVVGWTLQVNRS